MPLIDRATALEMARELEGGRGAGALMKKAADVRDQAWGNVVTYSPKVFIPLTMLCRDVCHYCTFARPPSKGQKAFMTTGEVLEVARRGVEAGCKEALFTLGDKPERRYRVARDELQSMGFETTLEYVAHAARAVLDQTGLLPHLNPGVMTAEDLATLKTVAPSMGLMLESTSQELLEKGAAHYGSPDKDPGARLSTIAAAGREFVPLTTGMLIGIGECLQDRVDTLIAIQELHERYGHIQEVIIQNFRAKAGTLMHAHPEPGAGEMIGAIVLARLLLSPEISLQAPPNLAGTLSNCSHYLDAGVNDWGGVSPVTKDFVNPEAPWPEIERLRELTESKGFMLVPRLTVYPRYLADPKWVSPSVRRNVLAMADSSGLAGDFRWHAGTLVDPPDAIKRPDSWSGSPAVKPAAGFSKAIAASGGGLEITDEQIVRLFAARGPELQELIAAADDLRRQTCGDTVTYVVNRNINYTNMCYFKCGFCAFSKGPKSLNLRGDPYLLDLQEVADRTLEARARGATEVCLQGGIHPSFTGDFYISVLQTIKQAVPDIHIHAFSPLEVWQGAETKGVSLRDFLWELKDNGLGTLPGTAAEILDDEVRRVICPDKISTDQWATVAATAHSLGLKMTTTIMFGHADTLGSWARHLKVLIGIQRETGGFTEFVPLPFVHMAAPIFLKGQARRGPTFEEALKMHAVARLVLHPWITNIQTSWVKMGVEGARMALQSGCNDLGGTLMNEIISRSAGAAHGQELTPEEMVAVAAAAGRPAAQRDTLYRLIPAPVGPVSYDGDRWRKNLVVQPPEKMSGSNLA